jgi:hypothetical protein
MTTFCFNFCSVLNYLFYLLIIIAIVHWDTKLIPDLTGQENIDRFPVIVSISNIEQLLGVPQIPSSMGGEISGNEHQVFMIP